MGIRTIPNIPAAISRYTFNPETGDFDGVTIRDGTEILLSSSDPINLPLTNPAFLLLHAMISDVVWARGGGKLVQMMTTNSQVMVS